MYRNEIKTRSSIVVLRSSRLVVSIKCHPSFLFCFGMDSMVNEGQESFSKLSPSSLSPPSYRIPVRRSDKTATSFYVCAEP